MSDDTVHVMHEFIPKLLRRKVEKAVANRKRFIREQLEAMVPLLLANRNVSIARNKRKWRGAIPSIAETAGAPFDHWNLVKASLSPWRYHDNDLPLDPVVFGPHFSAICRLRNDMRSGSKWVDEFEQLHRNLARSPTRRVTVSAVVLTSINYWQALYKDGAA